MKLTETQFVMLDTETTHQDDPKVIELAGLRWVYNRPIEYTDFKENFIYPGCKICPASMSVHHILNEDVEGAPLIEEIQDEWDEWIGRDPIVAYNSDYDKGVLSKTPLFDKQWLSLRRCLFRLNFTKFVPSLKWRVRAVFAVPAGRWRYRNRL